MNGYRFELACPSCGGVLRHGASRRQSPTMASGHAVCSGCQRDWAVSVCVGPYDPSPAVAFLDRPVDLAEVRARVDDTPIASFQ